ncbi:MAG: hypothetical protein LJE64_06395, partial [Desulfofustis sp.]|nr:hypothetical protein [Desulfofustis sp.]
SGRCRIDPASLAKVLDFFSKTPYNTLLAETPASAAVVSERHHRPVATWKTMPSNFRVAFSVTQDYPDQGIHPIV